MALAPSPSGGVWEFVAIQAINVGHRPLEITMAGLMMNNGDVFTQARSNAGPLPIPRKLEDGESVSVLFDFPEVEKAGRERSQSKIVFTKAFVNDAEGNVYTSGLPRVMKDRKLSR
jgi:hypothetical protein